MSEELEPRSYAIVGSGEDGRPWDCVKIEWRSGGKWAVVYNGAVLNHAGEWEDEPFPSSRTPAFKRRTRFASPDEALAAYRAAEVVEASR
jgi:hypothetical protein